MYSAIHPATIASSEVVGSNPFTGTIYLHNKTRENTMTDKDIRICDNKGFHMDLPNGVTVSVQIGPGNYCDNNHAAWDAAKDAMDSDENWGSNTAECAAYVTGSNLSWVAVPGYTDVGGDDVCGYMNVSQVLDFINLASQLTGHEAKANPKSLGNRMMAELGDPVPIDYRNDLKLQEDERRVMDEFQQEETDEA